MFAIFNDNSCTKIVCCYSLTNVNDEMDILTFCNELSSLFQQIPKHNVLIIGEDINAQTLNSNKRRESYRLTLHCLSSIA